MSTTTRSRTQKRRTELEQHAAELEALGLGIAPGLPGDDRSEFVERAQIGSGQTPARRARRRPPGVPARARRSGRRPGRWPAAGSPSSRYAVGSADQQRGDRRAARRRVDGGGDRRVWRAARAADQASRGARDGGRADRPRRLRAASGAARRREQPAQRHDPEDADHRAREGRDRCSPRSRRQL